MARFDEETSNSLFEVLSNWESLLKAENINIHQLLKDTGSDLEQKPLPDKSGSKNELTKAFQPKKSEAKPKSSQTVKTSRRARGLSR